MLRRRTAHVGCTLLIALFVALLPAAGAPADPPDRPTRVMIVVIDQFLPEYVDRFDMANVRGLMNGGVNFERALLGHMAAETVVSTTCSRAASSRSTWAGPTRSSATSITRWGPLRITSPRA